MNFKFFFQALFTLSFTIFSCKKETVIVESPEVEQKVSNLNAKPPFTTELNEPSSVFVTMSGSNYVSSYGSSVNFGSNLPHQTNDPTGIYDGYPVSNINFVNWNDFPYQVPTIIDGPYFTILRPTIPASGLMAGQVTLTNIHNYHNSLSAIWGSTTDSYDQKKAKAVAVPSPVIGGPPNGPGEFIRITGLLVRDHLSPTSLSIVEATYQTPSTGELKLIGEASKPGGWKFWFYAPLYATAGSITKVVATLNGEQMTLSAFNLTWSVSGTTTTVTGTVSPMSGSTFTFNVNYTTTNFPNQLVGYFIRPGSPDEYFIQLWAPTGATGGAVTQVGVLQSGVSVAVSNFNLVWSGNTTTGVHVTGTITLTNGTIFTFSNAIWDGTV